MNIKWKKYLAFSTIGLFASLLLATVVCAQNSVVTVDPTVGSTNITTGTTSGNDTVTSSTGFGAITAGMRVVGPGIPFGTTVKVAIDSSHLKLSTNATATAASAAIRYGVFSSYAYAAGDAMGFPFTLQPFETINQIIVEDDDKQITSVDIAFFDTSFAATVDSATFAPPDSAAKHLVGYVTVGGTAGNKSLGNNNVLWFPPTTLPINFGLAGSNRKLYGQMITVGTPTFTVSKPIRIHFVGK